MLHPYGWHESPEEGVRLMDRADRWRVLRLAIEGVLSLQAVGLLLKLGRWMLEAGGDAQLLLQNRLWLEHLAVNGVDMFFSVPGAIATFVFGFGYLIFDNRRLHHATSPPAALPASIAPFSAPVVMEHDRVVVDATPQYLVGLFQTHLRHQAQRLVSPFIGKWLKISGTVSNVSEHKRWWTVSMWLPYDSRPSAFLASLRFEPQWGDRLSVVSRDTEINVIGQIDEVTSTDLSLEHCEII
jgi:hypothetical protein